jgi:hypothetical protein
MRQTTYLLFAFALLCSSLLLHLTTSRGTSELHTVLEVISSQLGFHCRGNGVST